MIYFLPEKVIRSAQMSVDCLRASKLVTLGYTCSMPTHMYTCSSHAHTCNTLVLTFCLYVFYMYRMSILQMFNFLERANIFSNSKSNLYIFHKSILKVLCVYKYTHWSIRRSKFR